MSLVADGNDAATTNGQGGSVALLYGDQCTAVDQLDGLMIGVTADGRAAEQTELLHRRGAEVLAGTSAHTENWADESAVSEATRRVIADPPDVLIATTGIGIRSWLSFAESQGLDSQLLALRPLRHHNAHPSCRGRFKMRSAAVRRLIRTRRMAAVGRPR